MSFAALGMWSEGNTPKKWGTNSWFLLYDNAEAYRLVLVKNFLAINDVTALEPLPYSPNLV